MNEKRYYRLMYRVAKIGYPYAKVSYEEPLDDGPFVFVCNHAGVRGPLMMTLNFPRPHKNWINSFAMDDRLAANYAFHDYLLGAGRRHPGFWRALSRVIGRGLPPLLRGAGAIPVYHDLRVAETFRASVDVLRRGEDLVIFPESPIRATEFVFSLNRGFADLGRRYLRETGETLRFCPVYVEKKHRRIAVGSPIAYDPAVRPSEAREKLCRALEEGIDRLARSLPKHKPVPFLPPRWYRTYGAYARNMEEYWKLFSEDREEN